MSEKRQKPEQTMNICVFNTNDRTMLPKLPLAGDNDGVLIATLLVCGETRPFRFLARNLEIPNIESATALDLGCSTGETTHLLTKRMKKVIGIDCSQEAVDKGICDHPNLDLRVFDVLAEKELLGNLIREELDGKPVFYVDIGGDRMENIVIIFLSYLIETYHPYLLVVKSRKLHKQLCKTCLEDDRVHCSVAKWEALVETTKQQELKDRKCFHPKRYGLKLVPNTEMPICRYHNYAENGCKKAEECDQDHTHCHHCLIHGHRASDCAVLAAELIVRKRG